MFRYNIWVSWPIYVRRVLRRRFFGFVHGGELTKNLFVLWLLRDWNFLLVTSNLNILAQYLRGYPVYVYFLFKFFWTVRCHRATLCCDELDSCHNLTVIKKFNSQDSLWAPASPDDDPLLLATATTMTTVTTTATATNNNNPLWSSLQFRQRRRQRRGIQWRGPC